MPFLLNADTPVCPPEYQLEMSYVELTDERDAAQRLVTRLKVAAERTRDPLRLAALKSELDDAIEELFQCQQAVERELYGDLAEDES